MSFAFLRFDGIEKNLLGAFRLKESNNGEVLSNILKLSDRKMEVLFEGNSTEELDKKIADFPIENRGFDKETEVYKNYPINFLSENTIEKLKSGEYKAIANEGLKRIYSPFGFLIVPPNIDPYGLSTDFVLSLYQKDFQRKELDGKFYVKKSYTITSNQDIEKAINYSKIGGVYLLGTPIHSYLTAQKSSLEINIIGIIVTALIFIFFKLYFKSPKSLYYTILSIMCGIVTGFCSTVILFQKIHILTLVFSTTIIGISLDYSIHYFLSHKEKDFWRNLTSSMLTTVFAFLILAFSQIRLLEEIAIFTSFGLIGVYFFIFTFMPDFGTLDNNKDSRKLFKKLKPYLIIFCAIIILSGGYKISFDDNINNLYKPSPELLRNEKLSQNIFPKKQAEFIIIEGKNTEEILEKEEKLNIKNSIGLSNFISSKKKQAENIELVKNLYKHNLNSYAEFLNDKDKQSLKEKKYETYDVEKFPMNKMFSTGKNKSFIIVSEPQKNSVNPQKEYSKILKTVRIKITRLIPIILLLTGILSGLIFGIKRGLKILIPPILGMFTAISFISLCGIQINIFILTSMFLIFGFSLDYSVFLSSDGENSIRGVTISALSTMISFVLLSFTSFYPVQLIGVTVTCGILTSYLIALFLFEKRDSLIQKR